MSIFLLDEDSGLASLDFKRNCRAGKHHPNTLNYYLFCNVVPAYVSSTVIPKNEGDWYSHPNTALYCNTLLPTTSRYEYHSTN